MDHRGRPLRILFVAPYVPSRLRPRPLHLMEQLLARGHSVSLLAIGMETADREALSELRSRGIAARVFGVSPIRSLGNCAVALGGDVPLQAAVHSSAELRQAVTALADGFDVLHIEHLRAALSAPERISTPIVFDSVDSIGRLWELALEHAPRGLGAMLARLDLGRTHRFEARLTERFSRVLVSSQADRDHLANITPNDVDSIRIVRNGVDVEYFHPSSRRRDPATVVFVGRMSYHANIEAARRLLEGIVPRIWRHRPDVRVVIVGERPPRSLKALAHSLGPRVELTGYVPDVREFLAAATITVAPLVYAVGVQNKILEAMATETPVVCSPPALGGLQAVPGRDLVAAESDDDIARQALQLLSDLAMRETFGRAGRRCVAEHHSWSAAGDQLERIYRELLVREAAETA